MSAHVLLNLLNELGKRDKCEACRAFYLKIFATNLINSIIQQGSHKLWKSWKTRKITKKVPCMEKSWNLNKPE